MCLAPCSRRNARRERDLIDDDRVVAGRQERAGEPGIGPGIPCVGDCDPPDVRDVQACRSRLRLEWLESHRHLGREEVLRRDATVGARRRSDRVGVDRAGVVRPCRRHELDSRNPAATPGGPCARDGQVGHIWRGPAVVGRCPAVARAALAGHARAARADRNDALDEALMVLPRTLPMTGVKTLKSQLRSTRPPTGFLGRAEDGIRSGSGLRAINGAEVVGHQRVVFGWPGAGIPAVRMEPRSWRRREPRCSTRSSRGTHDRSRSPSATAG